MTMYLCIKCGKTWESGYTSTDATPSGSLCKPCLKECLIPLYRKRQAEEGNFDCYAKATITVTSFAKQYRELCLTNPSSYFPLNRTILFKNRKDKMNGLVKVSLLTLVLSSLAVFCWAEEFSGRVVAVKDGDTIEVLHLLKAERIRLADIDCPEMGQPFGNRAKQFTGSLVFGKEVLIKSTGKDRYGRTVERFFWWDECR